METEVFINFIRLAATTDTLETLLTQVSCLIGDKIGVMQEVPSPFDDTELISSKVIPPSSIYVEEKGKFCLLACVPARDTDAVARNFSIGEGIVGQSAEFGETIFVENTENDPSFVGTSTPKSLLCVPLVDNGRVLAVINYSAPLNEINYSDEAEEFVKMIAATAAMSFNNVLMKRKLEESNLLLEEKVEERTSSIQSLLDHVGQGLFSFGKEGIVRPEHSAQCHSFFGESPVGKDVVNLLFNAPCYSTEEGNPPNNPAEREKELEAVRKNLALIYENWNNAEMLMNFLPKETMVGNRNLTIEWKQIGSLIMVLLTDVTAERMLDVKLSQEQKRVKKISAVSKDVEDAGAFIRGLKQLLVAMQTQFMSFEPEVAVRVNSILQELHGAKGSAGFLGFAATQEKIHELETLFQPYAGKEVSILSNKLMEFIAHTNELDAILNEDIEEILFLIPPQYLGENEEIFYRISETKISELRESLFQVAQVFLPEREIAIFDVLLQKLTMVPLSNFFEKMCAVGQDAAEKIKKDVQFQVTTQSEKVEVDPNLIKEMEELMHVVRNCVDHGIEAENAREAQGKNKEGNVFISAKRRKGGLVILIQDDGQGLDPKKIGNIAKQRGLVDDAFLQNAHPQDIVNLIFSPGFSTASQITTLSGRGVGMDAVKEMTEKLGGSVQVKSQVGKGTSFEFFFPDPVSNGVVA